MDNEEPPADETYTIKSQCWNGALDAFGTSYVFHRRARILGRRLNVVTYIGFLVPIVVGGLALAYSHLKSLPTIIAVASALIIVQTVVSLWSIIGGWVASYSYSTASAADNARLAKRYEDLATRPPSDLPTFRHEYDKLAIRDEARQEQDYQQGLSDAEARRGMRAALRQYERECPGCNKAPVSMIPADCGVCGSFGLPFRRRKD